MGKTTLLVGLSGVLLSSFALIGCNDLPPGAYSLASDPLPDRAWLVSNEQFDGFAKSPRFHSVSGRTLNEQEQAATAEEQQNDEAIKKYAKDHPEARRLVPDAPSESHVRKNRDGSFSHPVKLRHGVDSVVTTLSQRWVKSTVAHAARAFGTRENQLAQYRMYYESLSDRLRHELLLKHPEELEKDPLFTADAIKVLNSFIASSHERIHGEWLAQAGSVDFGRTAPARCADEEGSGPAGSDRAGGSDTDARCAPKPTGVFRNYSFAVKPLLTCVKNQAMRGSCVAFASASAYEASFAKANSRWLNLSEQALYEHAKLVWFRQDFDDGLVTFALALWLKTQSWKLPAESAWEYNPSFSRREDDKAKRYATSCRDYDGTCSDSSHQAQVVCTDREKYRYCGFYAHEDSSQGLSAGEFAEIWDWIDTAGALSSLKAHLDLGHSVVWSVPVTPSWDAAGENGFLVYNGNGEKNRGGHAVHAVGYIDNATLATVAPTAPAGAGGGYLIVRNSWSNCWGDGGYLYVPYAWVKHYTHDAVVMKAN